MIEIKYDSLLGNILKVNKHFFNNKKLVLKY